MNRKNNVWKWIAAVAVLILACAAGFLIGRSAADAKVHAAQELNYQLNRSELDGLLVPDGTIYVTGHKSPDSDTVGSAIPSKEIPGLIFFIMDWLDLLAVQGTLKSLLHHHSSKASILRRSAFFTVQLSHPYMTTGKTIALTRQTFVGITLLAK